MYTSDSSIISPLTEEFADKKRSEILDKIETAYKELKKHLADKPEIQLKFEIVYNSLMEYNSIHPTESLDGLETTPEKKFDDPSAQAKDGFKESDNHQELKDSPPKRRFYFSGRNLRNIRSKLGFQINQISKNTKIGKELLKNIESEKFDVLPDENTLKACLRTYARYIGLNDRIVVKDYIERYRDSKQ